MSSDKARVFLLVDLRDFFSSDFGSEGRKKQKQKNSENDQLTGHFQSVFVVLISPEQTVKLVK